MVEALTASFFQYPSPPSLSPDWQAILAHSAEWLRAEFGHSHPEWTDKPQYFLIDSGIRGKTWTWMWRAPEDGMTWMLLELNDYERMGVRTIRVVDPKTQTPYRFEHGGLEPIKYAVEQCPRSLCSIDWAKVRDLLAD